MLQGFILWLLGIPLGIIVLGCLVFYDSVTESYEILFEGPPIKGPFIFVIVEPPNL